jgi:hypothetical protein
MGPAVDRAIASAEVSVERVGEQLERAISRTVLDRARRRRTHRAVLAVLAAAAAAGVALAAYQPWARGPQPLPTEVVASSSLVEIVRVSNPSGERSGCFRVEGRSALSRTGVPRVTVCPEGETPSFETYALVGAGGVTAFYGRARIPHAVEVVLAFPGKRTYTIDLQRDGFWAWDAPSPSFAHDRRHMVVLALDTRGRVLERDNRPIARDTT